MQTNPDITHINNTISPTSSGESVSIEDVFDKTYAIYPTQRRAKQKADKLMLVT